MSSSYTWDRDRARERIDSEIDKIKTIDIRSYKKDMDLENIPTNVAYRVFGVHLYADIINIGDILETTDTEGEICHKRTLRFLNQHCRAVQRVLNRCDAKRVDFHGQRLHCLVAKPYDSEDDAEAKRVRRAVAIAQLIIDVLNETCDDDEQIPNAKVCVGIDTGQALAVNNGRRGGREPLFLGEPANQAAKHSASKKAGIYLTNTARTVIGLAEVERSKTTALTCEEIEACQRAVDLPVTKAEIVKEWRQDMKDNPIGKFEFSGHTPPMRKLVISELTPANSRRQELVSCYGDIDGFTAYVASHITDNAEDVVRTLHVIRSELDHTLTSDFDGRRIRFIGDCLHGVLCEGTAQTTYTEETISGAVRCAGALRSSFALAIERLQHNGCETGDLGIAVGIEYGPTAISRLGMQGDRVRCAISRAVLKSEREQARCKGNQTAIGPVAYAKGSKAVRKLFGENRIADDLDYVEATEQLADEGEKSAQAARVEAYRGSAPAVVEHLGYAVRPYCGR